MRRGNHGHCRRLHEFGWVRLGAGNMNCLQRVGFIERRGKAGVTRTPFACLIIEFDKIRDCDSGFGERELRGRRFWARGGRGPGKHSLPRT